MPAEGFEPPTYGLQNRCTTTVLSRRIRELCHLRGSAGILPQTWRPCFSVAAGRGFGLHFSRSAGGARLTCRSRSKNESSESNKTNMTDFHITVVKTIQSKKLHRSAGAVAGFASAMSVLVGLLAGYATPRGWGRVSMALHMTKKPFILKLAPFITGTAVALATAAGLLGFYLWLTERPEESPTSSSEG